MVSRENCERDNSPGNPFRISPRRTSKECPALRFADALAAFERRGGVQAHPRRLFNATGNNAVPKLCPNAERKRVKADNDGEHRRVTESAGKPRCWRVLKRSTTARVTPYQTEQSQNSGYEPEGREFESLRAHHL